VGYHKLKTSIVIQSVAKDLQLLALAFVFQATKRRVPPFHPRSLRMSGIFPSHGRFQKACRITIPSPSALIEQFNE